MAASGTVFDQLAATYDASWSTTPTGVCQREAVWRWIDPIFERGQRVLDIGCGTGVDALHLLARGVDVSAIDASAEMVLIARSRGIDVRRLPVELLRNVHGRFDGALSNFGVLNCTGELQPIARDLAGMIRPQGYMAICVMGRGCGWEVAYYLRRLRLRKSFRRWNPVGSRASMGIHVRYPSVRHIVNAFSPEFHLERWCGIGLFVPPSYVATLSANTVRKLAHFDRRLAHWPFFRALADHRLLIFRRV
jgi:SAM-dependent methyltransferase